jgi:hypothetical protein
MTRRRVRTGIVLAAILIASSAYALDPLRPLTPDEVAARDRIRQGLLGNDPEGERATVTAGR